MIAYKRQKYQNKMKQKREKLKKPKKNLGGLFANLALAKAQVKNKRSSNYFYQKDTWHAQKNAAKPCYKFAKMDHKNC